ncbi:tyrosine--tRNA ligase [candidate division CSSED10-310 bacterium]|uniref:Tyrosine--tRNA ligase n=1 Tax=candidate division CSSED10-310 bacterium TaxID=2855610 RepID=A0ABV6YWX8_UNCC1
MVKRNLTIDEQTDILMRGTRFADEADWSAESSADQSLRKQMSDELREKLKSGKPLRVYLGVDPTSSHLHVGHFVPLQKLRKFQELGHHVIFLIGDYTAMIGDPSGRDTGRDRLTHEQVLEMARTYKEQAFCVLDPEATEVRYNSEWLAKLTFADIVELASIFPLKQIISRRDFQERLAQGESLRFHEALYTLMQGYDAYALECDVQVGAYDQHFNMLSGRTIQTFFGQTSHVMVTNPLLIGTDGRKMSKSFGNTINIKDDPFDMYGKTMRISDDYIRDYLELASSLPGPDIDRLLEQLKSGENPMDVKKHLAWNLVALYYDEQTAQAAQQKFQTVVQKKEAPDEIPVISVPERYTTATWIDLLAGLSLTKSKGEARRLIQQGGFYVEQQAVDNLEAPVSIPEGGVLIRLGKRRYYRLIR